MSTVDDASFTAGELPDLQADFPSHSYTDWREAAEALLKGAPFDKVMVNCTLEGFDVQPIHRRQDLEGLPHLGEMPGTGDRSRGSRLQGYTSQGWLISQELVASTPEEFNTIALQSLSRGQNELNILLDMATRAGRDPDSAATGRVGACGLSLATLGDMHMALRDIHLDMVSIYLRSGSSGLPVASLLFALAQERKMDLAQLRGCIEVDPLASAARLGRISVSLDTAFHEMALLTRYATENAPQLQTIGVQGTPYHDGGAGAVQELAYVMATAVQYIREMLKRDLTVDEVAPRMRLCLAVGTDFFMEIAKLRAARLLWSRIIDAFGGNDGSKNIHLHARTGLWGMTRRDAYVNMLRGASEAFSAVVGGCDSLHVGPFDEILRVPDTFSRRIARNVQIILQEECELTRTIDPAGGSYTVEWLTDQLARQAWAEFQKIEAAGGMTKALQDGLPQAAIAQTSSQKAKQIAQRRRSIIGTNVYPNADEKPVEMKIPDYGAIREKRARQISTYRTSAGGEQSTRIMDLLQKLADAKDSHTVDLCIQAVHAGASIGEMSRALRVSADETPAAIAAVPFRRAAEDFEALRDAADIFATDNGAPPQIFQANMGPSRNYRARADWTSAFFIAGGFQVQGDQDFATPEAAAEAAAQAKAQIVVITATDETYAEVVAPLAGLLKKQSNPPYVIVAGAPGDHEQTWRDAGVDDFVNVRVNNYDLNRKLLEQVGALTPAMTTPNIL